MSYVHCGYCGQRGHNRLGCPERKRDARKNPDSYLAKQLAREQSARERAVAKRVCSYCNQPGHNRRGCKILKEDKSRVQRKQESYNEYFKRVCTRAGLGPGAIIKKTAEWGGGWKTTQPYNVETYSYLDETLWENISFLNKEWDIDPGRVESRLPWRFEGTRIFNSRFIGYGELPPAAKEDEWFSHKNPGDNCPLTMGDLVKLIPDAFRPSSTANLILEDANQRNKTSVELVSPVDVPFPSNGGMPHVLLQAFKFDPAGASSAWDKNRLPESNLLWGVLEEVYDLE